MTILSWVFFVFNVLLAGVSFVPCFMGGLMGMDSPQAQKNPIAIIICTLFLTFPLVCLLCGAACPILNYLGMPATSVIFGVWPLFEAALVLGFIILSPID